MHQCRAERLAPARRKSSSGMDEIEDRCAIALIPDARIEDTQPHRLKLRGLYEKALKGNTGQLGDTSAWGIRQVTPRAFCRISFSGRRAVAAGLHPATRRYGAAARFCQTGSPDMRIRSRRADSTSVTRAHSFLHALKPHSTVHGTFPPPARTDLDTGKCHLFPLPARWSPGWACFLRELDGLNATA